MTTGSAVTGGWPLHSSDRPNDGYSSGYAGFGNDGEMLPVLVFDLGAEYDISGIHLWNGNNSVGYWSAFEDVNVFKVSSLSLTVPGSGGTALSCNRVAVPNGADAGESRSLSITGARYLLFQVTDAFKGDGDGNLAAVSPGYFGSGGNPLHRHGGTDEAAAESPWCVTWIRRRASLAGLARGMGWPYSRKRFRLLFS